MTTASADRLADAIDKFEGSKVLEELGAVREAVEELYILLDHVWRNREELRDILAATRPEKPLGIEDAEAVYCCTNPKLEWNGDPDNPGVACANCDYVVADSGSLVVRSEDEEPPNEPQKTLF